MKGFIKYPTLDEIIEINKRLGESGVLVNRGNLEFTLEKVKEVKTITNKATILLYDIIRLHPFLDGNKRTAFHTILYFLELNSKTFKYGYKDEWKIEKMLNRIATKKENIKKVEEWIEKGIK